MMMRYLDEAVETCENLIEQLYAEQAAAPESISQLSFQANPQSWTQACQTVGNVLTGMGFVEESYPWRLMALDATPERAKFYAESGRVYSQCEVWDKAIYFCQRTLEYQPDNISVRCRLAQIYNQVGSYRQESQVLSDLLAIRPDRATAEGHYQLGQIMAKQGQSQAAQSCYERAIEQDSQYAQAYYALGELLATQQQWKEAITLFERLIQQLETREESVLPNPQVTEAQSSALETKAMAHYRLGRVYRQSGQLEQAVAQFRQALQLDAQLHWAYMGLLNALMQMQRWDEVIEPCRKMAHRAQEFPWVYTFMGNAFAGKKDWQQAAVAHRQAFKLRGWTQCATREYAYGQTWFAQSIPMWEKHLADFIQSSTTRSPIQALALGSYDDGSLCWLMDKVLVHPEDRLICIAPQMSKPLQDNLQKIAHLEKLHFTVGEMIQQLAAQPEEVRYSLALIQSDYKEADYMQPLLSQVWQRLYAGGVLIIKDYLWRHPSDPNQSSQTGIDAFVMAAGNSAEVLHRAHQLVIKKTAHKTTQAETVALQEIPNA